MTEIRTVVSKEDIDSNWEVIHQLRPHLRREEYNELMVEMLESGYQLSYIEEDGKSVSCIGYRNLQFLYNGRHIYIDDLSTLEEYRGRGYAGKLLDYVSEKAKKQGCRVVTLDSGTHRSDAHRLYMNKGFVIDSYHFSKDV